MSFDSERPSSFKAILRPLKNREEGAESSMHREELDKSDSERPYSFKAIFGSSKNTDEEAEDAFDMAELDRYLSSLEKPA